MTAFTLGVHNLPAAEVVLIKTLIRLLPAAGTVRWHFAETGPYDAVLTDTTQVGGEVPASLARAVLKITRARAAADADSIARPIRAEQLQAWLTRQGERLQLLPRLAVPAASRAAPSAAGTAAVSAAPSHATGPRFKLRRWPSAALLKNDPHRIRLATLLSRRALAAHELSHISRLSTQQCQDFVDTLHQTGLIEVERTPAATATPRKAPAAAVVPRPLAGGLIGGIRRRLGL
jgi:hypothetical protein